MADAAPPGGRAPSARGPRATRAEEVVRRTLGAPALFAIGYGTAASAVYFSLGVISGKALGLTPFVFLAAGLFFVLCQMTYVEGASLHQERAGSTVFARYAFNEFWSFVAGWALLLDYIILIAIAAFTAANYLAVFGGGLNDPWPETLLSVVVVLVVAFMNVRGITIARLGRVGLLSILDLAVQLAIVVVGLALVFDLDAVVDTIDLGTTPSWEDALFGVTVAAAPFIGLEAGAGLAGEVKVGRTGLRRLVIARTVSVLVVFVGIAVVAMSAFPVVDGATALGENPGVKSPLVSVAGALEPGAWWTDPLRYVVGVVGFLVLVTAANSAMLGLSRLSYSLATNRQIPSAVGRLEPRRATPFVAIGIAALLAIGLVLVGDLDFLVGIFAFGAMLAITLAHLSVAVLRYREPERDRPYKMPLSVRLGRGELPVPAVVGAVGSLLGLASILVFHGGARYVGIGWMAAGLLLFVVYRTTEGKSLTRRVTIPEKALRTEAAEAEYGSILVPLLGTPLDDDIVQTAGRLASAADDEDLEGPPTIEAIYVLQVPMSLPLDAALPDEQVKRGRQALARAKAVGEEYEGVEVATALVRARSTGQAIVVEARRRGVEVIVLAAEEPSRIRGGAVLGSIGGPLDNFISDATRYVVTKAACRVILTAPPAPDAPAAPGSAAAETAANEPDELV
jgi:basic amino acid/polyamine antiporter, APA family